MYLLIGHHEGGVTMKEKMLQLVEHELTRTPTTGELLPIHFPAGRREVRCSLCNGQLRLSRPAGYDQDAVYTCNACGRIHLIGLPEDSSAEEYAPVDDGWLN